MTCLPADIGKCAPGPPFRIARLQCVSKSHFLGPIKKAHLASAVYARLIDAPHRVFH